MGSLYPDNRNRADRVNQLAADIAQIQTQVKEAVEDAHKQDEYAVQLLDVFAKQRGFKTLDELVKDAEAQLSPEDKQKYNDMKKELQNKDDRIDLAIKSTLGYIGTGLKVGLTGLAISALFQRSLLRVSLHAIGLGLVKIFTGQFGVGVDVLRAASRILGSVLKGEYLAGSVATAFKVFKVAGQILSVLGIALDAIVLIYEIVDGAKQREELRKAIKELCLRRLTTKKIQQYTRVTLQFATDVSAAISYTNSIQELVLDGTIPQSTVDKKVRDKLAALGPKIEKAVNEVDDASVYAMLQQLDSSRFSWTNEDPSFAEIMRMAEEELANAEL
ncbi:hypothetical protein AX16_005020 [Volvariella volvacea WC 439]|nr:hypothetical protein AX16_005020 [Volvariella volvacea WC 439]